MPAPLITCRGQCPWFDGCGGLDETQPTLEGCFASCGRIVEPEGVTECQFYSWACPCRGDAFHALVQEVGTLYARPWKPLRPPAIDLPAYIPIVRHGSGRRAPLSYGVVGISITDLMPQAREATYGPIVHTPEALRAHFGLAPGTKVILSGVANDPVIEYFWRYRTVNDVVRRLAALDIAAVTTPNFSLPRNAPRTHSLYNLKRILISTENLSAGLGVIPHIHAQTEEDWLRWAWLLRGQRDIRYVACEMQTGHRSPARARWAIEKLCEMQDRVGRALHPVAMGAVQHTAIFAEHFDSFTVVDSHPFMSAVKQREIMRVGRRRVMIPRDTLLRRNIRRRQQLVESEIERVRRRRLPIAS